MDIELKRKVIRARERVTGLSQEQLINIGLDEEVSHVERLTGKKVGIPEHLGNMLLNRGNPYIAVGNMTSMENVDDFIEGLQSNGGQKKKRFSIFAKI